MKPSPAVTTTAAPKGATPVHESTPAPAPSLPLGWSEVVLPSRGNFYGDRLPGGKIQMRAMLGEEIALVSSSGGDPISRIISVLEACSNLQGLAVAELTASDQLMAALALRTITYGPDYTFAYYCTRCGAKQSTSVNIQQELDEKPAPEDLKEPVLIKLPDSGHTVGCRFLRVSDIKLTMAHAKKAKAAKSRKKSTALKTVSTDSAGDYLYRLSLTLLTIDGEEPANIFAKEAFLKQASARDCLTLERHLEAQEPGINTTVYPECEECDAENEMTIPFDAEFFRPTSL